MLLTFIVLSPAQTSGLFQWGFGDGDFSHSLQTCASRPVALIPLDGGTTGTPPYFMMAFVLGRTLVRTYLGDDVNNLTWPLTEPVGSQMALSVVDANGISAGMPPIIYTVTAGPTINPCTTTPSATPNFKITTDVTGNLSTCQPWRFTITGGVPPYAITLQAFSSYNVTRATIPVGDDRFTYINRAEPDTSLFGAVSDSAGHWAYGTAMVNTTGSNDTECPGLGSSSDNSTILLQQGVTGQSSQRHNAIVAVSVTLLLLFMISLGIAGLLYLRKRRKQADEEITVRPLAGLGSLLSIKGVNRYLTSTPSKALGSTKAAVTRTAGPEPRPPSRPSVSLVSTMFVPDHTQAQASQFLEDLPLSVSDYSPFDDGPINSSRSMVSLPSFANFPLTSIRPTHNLNNPNRPASCDDAESNQNEAEPALSDTGSVVLPRSSRNVAARTGKTRANQRQVKNARYDSQGSRALRGLPPPYTDWMTNQRSGSLSNSSSDSFF
ncbi:hypothetical protein BYT27DRAFT_7188489 [Phlegmacium glaucopus]|nr:hypothetical protein BYT27DRAFT_7188489 [Phlegmacium glaucopus]